MQLNISYGYDVNTQGLSTDFNKIQNNSFLHNNNQSNEFNSLLYSEKLNSNANNTLPAIVNKNSQSASSNPVDMSKNHEKSQSTLSSSEKNKATNNENRYEKTIETKKKTIENKENIQNKTSKKEQESDKKDITNDIVEKEKNEEDALSEKDVAFALENEHLEDQLKNKLNSIMNNSSHTDEMKLKETIESKTQLAINTQEVDLDTDLSSKSAMLTKERVQKNEEDAALLDTHKNIGLASEMASMEINEEDTLLNKKIALSKSASSNKEGVHTLNNQSQENVANDLNPEMLEKLHNLSTMERKKILENKLEASDNQTEVTEHEDISDEFSNKLSTSFSLAQSKDISNGNKSHLLADGSKKVFQYMKSQGNHDLVQQAKLVLQNKKGEVKISLNPKEFGNVKMTFTIEDSKIIGKIIVGSELVKDAMQKNIDNLAKQFLHEGYQVEGFFVSVDSNTSENHNGEQVLQNNLKRNSARANEYDFANTMMNHEVLTSSSSVDFVA